MKWINVYGLVMIAVIMIPNIAFAVRCRDGFENLWQNRFVEIAEQAGQIQLLCPDDFQYTGGLYGF